MSSISDILARFPGRKHQAQQLFKLYGHKDETFVDTLYIYGGPSTGKTALVSATLASLSVKHALINLPECYTSKILFETILNKLAGHKMDIQNAAPYAKCDNMMDFLFHLQKLHEESSLENFVIVLDKVELLRNREFNLLPGFMRFRELSGLPISVILISELPLHKFYVKCNVVEPAPLKLYFPQYTKDELFEILCLDFQKAQKSVWGNFVESKNHIDSKKHIKCKNHIESKEQIESKDNIEYEDNIKCEDNIEYKDRIECINLIDSSIESNNSLTSNTKHSETDRSHLESIHLELYRNYLNVFLSVFHRACRNFSELRYMARKNFFAYCQPIIRGECTENDSMALWRHIAPILKSSLEVLYLRVSKSAKSDQEIHFTDGSKDSLAQTLELPFYAKYLLIAAYLASYNPAKDDKRLFMKYHGKKTKSMKDIKTKSKVSELLNTQLGPKLFSFDRLLAIFYAILDDKVGFNNNLLVQVTSLVELQLLSALSDNCNLDGQKYKCTVSFDFILGISKMVGFNIRKYLSDFSHL